ncbi:guanine nucleotide-binding protein G(I)/G(S)/G(O) subunit gamma-5 isoform X2 [Panthera leo]|uniref:guanine nucleotide-binding protein G(I)/G(S)/G(O) subunit gamma-5 isoform X2 n=1 Tax=Panthera leo TaxID=9689 RepID=UPI001C6981A2|nr:guanine nucleotide-binding protein G(I)/G(S)/G(O) subunit gamma-5 isoform X2 [Panthera leo]
MGSGGRGGWGERHFRPAPVSSGEDARSAATTRSGRASFREVAARIGAVVRGSVSAPFRARTFQGRLAPGLNHGFPHSGGPSLPPSAVTPRLAWATAAPPSAVRTLLVLSLPDSTLYFHWTEFYLAFNSEQNLFACWNVPKPTPCQLLLSTEHRLENEFLQTQTLLTCG